MKDARYKFLLTLCRLYDGENYVSEVDIRRVWKGCPNHNTILNFGPEQYFTRNNDFLNPAYIPAPDAFDYIRQRRNSKATLIIGIITLAVSVLTLLATCLIPLL